MHSRILVTGLVVPLQKTIDGYGRDADWCCVDFLDVDSAPEMQPLKWYPTPFTTQAVLSRGLFHGVFVFTSSEKLLSSLNGHDQRRPLLPQHFSADLPCWAVSIRETGSSEFFVDDSAAVFYHQGKTSPPYVVSWQQLRDDDIRQKYTHAVLLADGGLKIPLRWPADAQVKAGLLLALYAIGPDFGFYIEPI